VTVNDFSIPLLYVSPTQINAQLPFTVSPGNATMEIRNSVTGKVSNGITFKVVSSAPGIFTQVDNINQTVAAIFHSSNNTLVTPANQATRDEVLIMYVTGLGTVTPSVATGAATPLAPLSKTTAGPYVCIGVQSDGTLESDYLVDFSGLAPGFVGLYQINFTVPGDRVQSQAAPVVVSQGTSCATASIVNAPITAIR
jgi:uncharacterized protein (TIGR03437 family)